LAKPAKHKATWKKSSSILSYRESLVPTRLFGGHYCRWKISRQMSNICLSGYIISGRESIRIFLL